MAKLIFIYCLQKKKKKKTYTTSLESMPANTNWFAAHCKCKSAHSLLKSAHFSAIKSSCPRSFIPFQTGVGLQLPPPPPLIIYRLPLFIYIFLRIKSAKNRKDLSFCSVQNKNESRTRGRPLNSHLRGGSGRASVALAQGPARASSL